MDCPKIIMIDLGANYITNLKSLAKTDFKMLKNISFERNKLRQPNLERFHPNQSKHIQIRLLTIEKSFFSP